MAPQSASLDLIYLLAIDHARLPESLRGLAPLAATERARCLGRARSLGLPLVIVQSPGFTEFYTTFGARTKLLLPLLSEWRDRARGLTGLAGIPAVEASGVEAARNLLRRAARAGAAERSQLARSVAEARFAGALGAPLTELFELGLGREIEGDAPERGADPELDDLAAERAVEEEIVTWRASIAPPPSIPAPRPRQSSLCPPFPGIEASSVVRLKVAAPLPPDERAAG